MLKLSNQTLRFAQEQGVVRKVEHWSESHVSGEIKGARIHDFGGHISSSGGGGTITTEVKNWMRLYVDIGGGRETVHKVPGSFAAREGHTLIANYLDDGRRLELIKLANPQTGGWFKTGYQGADIIGRAWGRKILFGLAGAYLLFALYATYDDIVVRKLRITAENWYQLVLVFTLPTSVLWGLGALMTPKDYKRRGALSSFIQHIENA